MADFSISQFKQYVQAFINATGIDDGNRIIETKNGELAKVLSNFSLEESQIGDLLEKSANAQTRAASGEQPYPADIHKQFIEAQKKYDNMTPEQQKDVRSKTAENVTNNYNKLSEALMKQILEPLYGTLDLPNGNTYQEFKEQVTQAVATYVQNQHAHMTEMIEKYDNAFGEYDITYRSPFKVNQTMISPNYNNIADACMVQVIAKLQEYLATDTSALTFEEHLEVIQNLYTEITGLIQEKTNYIETVGEGIADNYQREFVASIEVLQSDNPAYVQWMPPLDDQPHEEEPDHIAIEGPPIKKTFTDVVNSSATGISSVNSDPAKAPVYDLNGRVVTGELQKGKVYIQNGKKFIAQ